MLRDPDENENDSPNFSDAFQFVERDEGSQRSFFVQNENIHVFKVFKLGENRQE